MTITVKGPDGSTFDFPDGTDEGVMTKAMQAHYGEPKAAPKAPDPGLFSKISSAITAPFKSTAKSIGDEYHTAHEAGKQDAASLVQDYKHAGPVNSLLGAFTDPKGYIRRTGEAAAVLGDEMDQAASPIMGPMHKAFGKTGGDVLAMAVPLVGEANEARLVGDAAKTAGVSANAMRTTLAASKAGKAAEAGGNTAKTLTNAAKSSVDPEHAKAVAQLQKEGVYLTPGQAQGGMRRTIEETAKSHPDFRQPVVEAERKSIDSFNRAAYNRALAPIGAKYDPNGPVGYDGIKSVEKTLGAAYDKIIPKLKLVHDDHLAMDLDDIKQDVSELPRDQQKQYETIMKNRFFLPMVKHGGEMNGQDFKDMESAISQAAATWKGSPDPAHRELGRALGASLGALRDNLERTSDPSVRQELKKVNSAWAAFVRLQGAATQRATSEGVFTPGDLLQSAKKADRTVRKGAFARGDALLQDLGLAGQKVLPSKIPDSGTALRVNATRPGLAGAAIGGLVGGVPGAALGAGADMLARPGVQALARGYLSRGSTAPKNYLAHATRAVDPLVHHAPLALPAAAAASQAQGQ